MLVLALFSLPRVVVENEADVNLEVHDLTIPEEDSKIMARLRADVFNENIPKKLNFADSLAGYYLKYGVLDSARWVGELMLKEDSSLNTKLDVVDIWYRVFERSSQSEIIAMANMIRPLLLELTALMPEALHLRNKLAMTLVVTETPMSGIAMLRKVLEVDPENREAILNLGLLSIQSGQFDKAITRFETLLSIDSTDTEAQLYRGVALVELGDNQQAFSIFSRLSEYPEIDPAIRQAAIDYANNLLETE